MAEPSDPDNTLRETILAHFWRAAPHGISYDLANAHANVPTSFEQFLLEKGEKKVEVKLDTRNDEYPWSHS